MPATKTSLVDFNVGSALVVGEAEHREYRLSELMPPVSKRWHGPYSCGRCSNSPPELLLRGIEQFNRREFFEQHETLEELWRGEPDDVRYLYQGILQVGVGFYHLRRRNYDGAVSKLGAGLERLRWFLPACQTVDVARLVEETRQCLEHLKQLGPEMIGEFDPAEIPKVHLTGEQ